MRALGIDAIFGLQAEPDVGVNINNITLGIRWKDAEAVR